MKLDHYLIPYTKINSKYIKFEHMTRNQKFLLKNMGIKLTDINDLIYCFESIDELMLLNCGVGKNSGESKGLQGDPTSQS